MDCSWAEIVRLAGWEFAQPGSNRTLAFVYTARVSLTVEESCAKINPNLPFGNLERILTGAPDWLCKRKDWLQTEWPQYKVADAGELELFALTAAKSLLAVGSQIPDGTTTEMANAFELMFPKLTAESNSAIYEAWDAHVTIETDGNMSWGYGGPLARTGKSLPVPDTNFGDRSAFELFLQNLMRIAIQQRIEGSAH